MLIPFNVTGVALARWSLVIPGDDDLDMYLLNSAGDIVAQSTNGGTDEHIELQNPADDTYTMAVHGWSVAEAAGLAFSLQSWLVSATPGGSLVIDSAPTAAVGRRRPAPSTSAGPASTQASATSVPSRTATTPV